MTPSHILQIAITELIESHCETDQLHDSDILGALHACIAYEETHLAFRIGQSLMKAKQNNPL
jgi:hypothetical protein